MAGKLPPTHKPMTRRALSILATQQARRLDRLGMSETMWEALGEVYRARLNRERGLVRATLDATLCALYQRGLVMQAAAPVDRHPPVSLWTTTDKGKTMVLEGPE